MDPALSFVMALAALLLTVGNMVLTAVLFRKSAGRVVVQMVTALLDPGHSLLTNDKGTWGLDTLAYETSGVELAKVVIENPGRIGATITKVSLRIEGAANPDLEIAVRPLKIQSLAGVSPDAAPPHRLEPFDQVIYLLDFWTVVNHVFSEEPRLRQVNIWASVKVAGQQDTYDSKSHGYWTVRREWASFMAPYTTKSARSIILSELMNVFDEAGDNPLLSDLAAKIEERISKESSGAEITAAFQQVMLLGEDHWVDLLGQPNVMAFIRLGWNVRNRVNAVGLKVTWTSDVLQ